MSGFQINTLLLFLNYSKISQSKKSTVEKHFLKNKVNEIILI